MSVSDGGAEVTELAGGCVLAAQVTNGVVVADGASCTFDDQAPLRQIGVISRKFSVFRLDPKQGRVLEQFVTVANTTKGAHASCAVNEQRILEVR